MLGVSEDSFCATMKPSGDRLPSQFWPFVFHSGSCLEEERSLSALSWKVQQGKNYSQHPTEGAAHPDSSFVGWETHLITLQSCL